MKRIRLSLTSMFASLLCASAAWATDTAFWERYVPDEHTYALIRFEGGKEPDGQGKALGAGVLHGDAAVAGEGPFDGALRVAGEGFAEFETKPFKPLEEAINYHNRSFSAEAWVKLERLPEANGRAVIVSRPAAAGTLGVSLFVRADGALGMRIQPAGSDAAEFVSPPETVPVGKWVHLAGIENRGMWSPGRNTLFVDGVKVYEGAGGSPHGTRNDSAAAPLRIGEGLSGWIDQVRLHARVGLFWPRDPAPWIDRIAESGLPPLDEVLASSRQPSLTFPLDGNARPVASAELHASDPAVVERFRVGAGGAYIPGVRGQAFRGRLDIGGFTLADLRQGSFEFWFRPHRVNIVSDRNVTIFESSSPAAYFFNSVHANRELALYWRTGAGHMAMHKSNLGTEFHPGRWYHLAMTWDAQRVTMYIDGQPAASGGNSMATDANRGLLNSLVFNPHHTAFDIDELAVYQVTLTEREVVNRYWNYVDPEKIADLRPPAPIRLDVWHLPSENTVAYRMRKGEGAEALEQATLRLLDENDREVLVTGRPFTDEMARLQLPELADGIYRLVATAEVDDQHLATDPIPLTILKMPWEGNTLGVTDEVFPPFEPIQVDGDKVAVVLRDYRMNGFGLWDSVVSQGRELLAAPIRLRYEMADGTEGDWTLSAPVLETAEPHIARYRARALSDGVTIEALSEIEMDGMMKVTMTMKPGKVAGASSSGSIESESKTRAGSSGHLAALWLDIPLKASETTLMHEDTGTMRRNYSGYIPAGEGVVWGARRRNGWQNAFCGYLWLGGEERGLAWFAENDRGWITEKGGSDRPLQEIVREGDRVILRVHLVNLPATIEEPREIVFGLQASPVKPMPADWRTGARGGGLPVTPWGGHQCADKFPFEDRWEIVDKIIETQLERKNNNEWFAEMVKKHDIPPIHGNADWLKMVHHFAWHQVYQRRPVLVYFEEMAASTYRPEWHVYKNEWARDLLDPRRSWPDGYDLFRQGRLAIGNYRATFGPSYRDYGAWYTNEWLKRGVGIYWDNSYLTTASNPFSSAAYEGNPGLTLWNQREYSKRTWNLLKHYERQRGEKLLFLQHMTNASLLPILAWTTTAMDNEFDTKAFSRNVTYPRQHPADEPFPPDYLRAQSLGRQTGCYPAIHHAQGPTPRSDWGMCRVHDIPGGGQQSHQLEKALVGFGYVDPDVVVHNYWAEHPALTMDRDDVKWLLLARPRDQRLFLVLQSWSREPVRIKGRFDGQVIGFQPAAVLVNPETQAAIPFADNRFEVELAGKYGTLVLDAGGARLPEGILFQDSFDDGPSPRWRYLSHYLQHRGLPDGGKALRLAGNNASWMGPTRLEMWRGIDDRRDGTLEIRFRAATTPTGDRTHDLFTVITRAGQPTPSQHGDTHTRLGNGQYIGVRADAAKGDWVLNRVVIGADGKRSGTQEVRFGSIDDALHTLELVMHGDTTRVRFDGVEVAAFTGTPDLGGGFGIQAGDRFPTDLDHVVFRVTQME